jgi:hypothetical protein
MALKDADHICRLNAYQLHKRANMPEEEVLECLRILSSPDTKRKENQEYEGRRIKAVEDGWLILNGEKYKEMVQREMKRARDRRAQAAARDRRRAAEEARDGAGAAREGFAEAHGFKPGSEQGDDAAEEQLPDIEHGGTI